MKAEIEVENRDEAKLIRKGLEDKEVRALVKVMGALDRLPSKQMKKITMDFVGEYFREQNRLKTEATAQS